MYQILVETSDDKQDISLVLPGIQYHDLKEQGMVEGGRNVC
jgi:hypothetical protein